MLKTRVGYAGGKKDKPSYRSIGDHTEAIQIEFDPKKIKFEALLKIFWDLHDECGGSWSTQYKAVLWTHGKAQASAAKKSAEALAKKRGRALTTAIQPAPKFWIAEDYHQKYSLRRYEKLILALLGPKLTQAMIRDSTVTARANGWVAGQGTRAQIAAESKALGLDAKARAELAKVLGPRAPTAVR